MVTEVAIKHAPRHGANMTAAEQETRVNLAACYRLVAHYGMDDKTSTHISARVPGTSDEFLLNPKGKLFSQIRASDLIKINLDGEILDDTPHTVIRAGFVIHSAVLGARPDSNCVIHTHTKAGMAVSAMECGLLPVNQKSMKFVQGMPYHDYQGYATDLEERDSLVANLGTHNWLILRNHGLLVAGPQLWTAFRWMYSLETACRVQVACMAGGTKLRLPTDDVVAHAASQANRPRNEDEPDEEWPAHLERLDAVDPSFRD
jgi:ribulose-5-phosphate 4-epimerase/fuculose-1-phosphate aldolase